MYLPTFKRTLVNDDVSINCVRLDGNTEIVISSSCAGHQSEGDNSRASNMSTKNSITDKTQI